MPALIDFGMLGSACKAGERAIVEQAAKEFAKNRENAFKAPVAQGIEQVFPKH